MNGSIGEDNSDIVTGRYHSIHLDKTFPYQLTASHWHEAGPENVIIAMGGVSGRYTWISTTGTKQNILWRWQ